MIKPAPLKPGARLRMIAPSGCLHVPDVKDEVIRCKERFEALGFQVEVDGTCYARYGYLAGDDQMRARALEQAFTDPHVDGVVCLKGGWGVNRMLPWVDFSLLTGCPKAFVGYSDITSLHLALHRFANLRTFHGPMGTSKAWPDDVKHSLLCALSGTPEPVFQKEKMTCLRPGKGTGEVVGGNLSLLAAACGTPYDMDFTGKILFIEEIGEMTYQIDRYLCQLKNAGKLDHLAGLVFGGFTSVKNEYPDSGFELMDVLAQYASGLDCPAAFGLSCGHIEHNLTLPLGTPYTLDADKGTMTLAENERGA